jgi:carbon-monoxide dehydrogenase small subunit
MQPTAEVNVAVTVNGHEYRRTVDARLTAADFLRDELELTGTHVGCEHGVCGACTVLVDGRSTRACILYAGQLDGAEVLTVEGLADGARLHPIQEALRRHHGLQCGFCTAGVLAVIYEYLSEVRGPDEADIRTALSGTICRCTGYQGMVDAVLEADRTWSR